MLGTIHFGGRITDNNDLLLLNILLKEYNNQNVIFSILTHTLPYFSQNHKLNIQHNTLFV